MRQEGHQIVDNAFNSQPAQADSGSSIGLHENLIGGQGLCRFALQRAFQRGSAGKICLRRCEVEWRGPVRQIHACGIFVGKIGENNGAAFRGEKLQGCGHDFQLKLRKPRRSERTPQFEGNPQGAWVFYPLRVQPDQTDCDRRHAFGLEIVAERAHGARAEGSNRRQQDAVDPILFQAPSHGPGVLLHAARVCRPHEGVMVRRDRADCAALSHSSQPINRQDNVLIPLESRTVEVDRHMAHQDLSRRRVRGDDAKVGIAGHEGTLAAAHEAG